jgi:hypothetical protein
MPMGIYEHNVNARGGVGLLSLEVIPWSITKLPWIGKGILCLGAGLEEVEAPFIG